MRWPEIGIAVLVSILTLWVQHWGPWQMIAKKKFSQTTNYVMGVLALQIPLSALLVIWRQWEVLVAVWAITIFGGLGVMGAYTLDNWIETRERAEISEQEGRLLRQRVDDDER